MKRKYKKKRESIRSANVPFPIQVFARSLEWPWRIS